MRTKAWELTFVSTILQILLLGVQIFVYEIINIACPVIVGSGTWINEFNNMHYRVRYCFLYGSTACLVIIFILILIEKIWMVKKESEKNNDYNAS